MIKTLKKEAPLIDRELFPVNLKYEDIKELIEILNDYYKYIIIKIDGYEETDNIESIKNHSTKNLKLSCKKDKEKSDSISIYFTKSITHLFQGLNKEDEIETRGVVSRVEDYLKTKRNNYKNLLFKFTNGKLFYFIYGIAFITTLYFENDKYSALIFLIYFLQIGASYSIGLHFYNSIKLIEDTKINFFQEFKNETPKALWQLIIGLILLGGGYLITQ